MTPAVPPAGHQVIEEQRRRLAELKQKAAAEAQCQWDALHGAAPYPAGPPGYPALMHHSILHHLPAGRERGEEGEHAYDTLSLESSDSMETSISTGANSACSPDNMSRCLLPPALCFCPRLLSPLDNALSSPSLLSASGLDMGKIEEMEKMLKEAHAEKSRLMESRVRLTGARRQQVVSLCSTPSPSTHVNCAATSLHFSNAAWEASAGCSIPTCGAQGSGHLV